MTTIAIAAVVFWLVVVPALFFGAAASLWALGHIAEAIDKVSAKLDKSYQSAVRISAPKA